MFIYRYWLYAAVNCKCLLVTNDEMRDHLFQLLGTSFFPRWKEKHQVISILLNVYGNYMRCFTDFVKFSLAMMYKCLSFMEQKKPACFGL